MPKHTVQNRLCLLPDQLGILLRYGELLGLTIIALLFRTLFWRSHNVISSKPDEESYIPLSTTDYNNNGGDTKGTVSPARYNQSDPSDSLTSSTHSTKPVTSRRGGGGGNGGSQLNGYGNIPAHSRSRSTSPSKLRFQADSDDWGNPTTPSDRIAYARHHHNPTHTSTSQVVLRRVQRLWLFRPSRTKVGEFIRSVVYIGVPVLSFYGWLLYRDL